MDQPNLNWIANYIWGIADDVLRDLYVRGKYRDVILPMTVLRRLDAVLEPTKPAVLDMKATLDKAGIVNQDQALRQASGQAFYNTSRFTLRDLRSRASQAAAQGRLRGVSRRLLGQRAGHPREVRVPQPDPTALQGGRAWLPHREARLAGRQPQPQPGLQRRRLGPTSRPRQPCDGHDLRGAGSPLQRGEQRGGGRALDAARRRQAHGEPDLPADRRPDRVGHLPPLRRGVRYRRHAHRRRGDAQAARRGARQAGGHPPLRPGDQLGDLRHRQGRSPAQGRGRGGRQHHRRARVLDPVERRLPVSPVRLHALQSARTGRAGRATSSGWAARTGSRTRAS